MSRSIYPIGFKSYREHASMFKLGVRARYTCEILDGGVKPLFQVISSEDPDHPIIKETATAAWVN